MPSRPRLRPLDFRPVHHQGEQMWLLQDPLGLSPLQLVLPAALAQMLPLCDGTRTVAEIHRDFASHLGVPVAMHIVEDTLAQDNVDCVAFLHTSVTATEQV